MVPGGNASVPILPTEGGRMTEVIEVLANASLPRSVRKGGRVIEEILVQYRNASDAIDMTLFPIITDDKDLELMNANTGIYFVLISTDVRNLHPVNAP
jgi:hypothetical protein